MPKSNYCGNAIYPTELSRLGNIPSEGSRKSLPPKYWRPSFGRHSHAHFAWKNALVEERHLKLNTFRGDENIVMHQSINKALVLITTTNYYLLLLVSTTTTTTTAKLLLTTTTNYYDIILSVTMQGERQLTMYQRVSSVGLCYK